MASGMASSHCGLAGTGCAFRLQLLLRGRVGEEAGHARCSLQVSRRSYRMQDGRRRGRDAHKGRYAPPNPAHSTRKPASPDSCGGASLRWSPVVVDSDDDDDGMLVKDDESRGRRERRRPSRCLARRPPGAQPGRMSWRAAPDPRNHDRNRSGAAPWSVGFVVNRCWWPRSAGSSAHLRPPRWLEVGLGVRSTATKWLRARVAASLHRRKSG